MPFKCVCICFQDILDIEGLQRKMIEFIKQKDQLCREMHQLVKSKERDRQKILEIIVENATDDVMMYGELAYLVGVDPERFDEVTKEKLKFLLFHILK